MWKTLLGMTVAGIMSSISVPTYAQVFSLNASSFSDQETIPALYTCDDKDTSPELTWSNAPTKTQSFALIVSDPDAPGGTFYHWVLYNIPANAAKLPEGGPLPEGTITGTNSWNKTQYKGPCPPKGATHHYIFSLYALDTTLNLPAGSTADAVTQAMQNHVLGNAKLTATYVH